MPDIAILIPCYNEGLTIEKVIRDFHGKLPEAKIYVYDNNSEDDTIERAESTHLCEIRKASIQGKGAVVNYMLHEIRADYYILVDGDATYPADNIRTMLHAMMAKKLNMIVGDRSNSFKGEKLSHAFGNRLVDFLIRLKFGNRNVTDTMSGLRIFDRRFAEGYKHNIRHNGFEIETEMTIWGVKNNMKLGSVPIGYLKRPEGSVSKLNTIRDGAKIIMLILATPRR